jgi:hypothetical protein
MWSSLDGAAPRAALVLLVSILALAPAAVVSAGEEPEGSPSSAEAGAAGTEEAAPPAASLPDAVTVTWNAAQGSMQSPSAEQAARLAAQFRQLLLAKAAEPGLRRLAPAGESNAVVLPDGMTRVRLSTDLLSFSVVRVDADGHLIQSCADGIDAAAASLTAPVPGSAEER